MKRPTISLAERRRRADEKYGVSADLLIGDNFFVDVSLGIFTLESNPRALQAVRSVKGEGTLVAEHEKLPAAGRAIIIPDAHLLANRPPGELPVAGTYQLQTRFAHFTIHVLPEDFAMIASAVGRALLTLHMIVDPPKNRRGRGSVRSAYFKIASPSHRPPNGEAETEEGLDR